MFDIIVKIRPSKKETNQSVSEIKGERIRNEYTEYTENFGSG